MRSALYYPHIRIRSENLIRTSLLLWDRVHVIVPWSSFRPTYEERDHARALELIGEYHEPSDQEKQQAHDMVEDFATRPLPNAFSYTSEGYHEEAWEIYRDK